MRRAGFAILTGAAGIGALIATHAGSIGERPPRLPKACIDGTGPGWRPLTRDDFAVANCPPDTFLWNGDIVFCKGQPVGVLRSRKTYTNFELVMQWRHLRPAGNSGLFVWVPPESVESLQPGQLPHGIEVQILDHAYKERYERQIGKKADWFTTHGDVFPVGTVRMDPFPPVAPDGRRSFPSRYRSRGAGQWNHYYVRCINGEVRLWVNGEEVSGGTRCEPHSGYLALESEGSPIEFRHLRVRELP